MLLARTNFFDIGLNAKVPWEYATHMYHHYGDIFYLHFYKRVITYEDRSRALYEFMPHTQFMGAK